MAKTKKQLHEGIRAKFIGMFKEYLESLGEEVLRVKSNEIAVPTLDEEGNEEFIVITFKVPTGSRDDGEAYDGYGIAEQYAENYGLVRFAGSDNHQGGKQSRFGGIATETPISDLRDFIDRVKNGEAKPFRRTSGEEPVIL